MICNLQFIQLLSLQKSKMSWKCLLYLGKAISSVKNKTLSSIEQLVYFDLAKKVTMPF